MELPQLDDYRQLLLNDAPLLDVRAPVEYEQGSFPVTLNAPIINNDERENIGRCYKQQGQDKAVELGHELVSGEIKQQRVQTWVDFVNQNPDGALFCFRGGMRSKLTQQWIYEQSGIIYPRVKGGYKAMRRFLLEELDASIADINFFMLSGRTGVGKTVLLHQFKKHIDLEGIYHHAGSAFGKMAQPQPSQIDVENDLSIILMKHRQQQRLNILLEDESANIGSRRLPENLILAMKQAPVIVLESLIDDRAELIYQQYVVDSRQSYQDVYGLEAGTQQWAENLLNSLQRIQRRLGGARYSDVQALMAAALKEPNMPAMEAHKAWIVFLLNEYYDPMYDYQLERKSDRVVFRGSEQAVNEYLRQNNF